MKELEDKVFGLQRKFVKSRFNPEKIGKLLFEYKDTHGLPVETSLEVIEEEINREWKDIVKQGVEYYKEKYERKGI